MGLVGLEKLAWLEAADSSDSRRVESYGSSPGSNGILGRMHENILNNYPKYIRENMRKIITCQKHIVRVFPWPGSNGILQAYQYEKCKYLIFPSWLLFCLNVFTWSNEWFLWRSDFEENLLRNRPHSQLRGDQDEMWRPLLWWHPSNTFRKKTSEAPWTFFKNIKKTS